MTRNEEPAAGAPATTGRGTRRARRATVVGLVTAAVVTLTVVAAAAGGGGSGTAGAVSATAAAPVRSGSTTAASGGTLSATAPAGHTSNWLPAPDGAFNLMIRAYIPTEPALTNAWHPPAIEMIS